MLFLSNYLQLNCTQFAFIMDDNPKELQELPIHITLEKDIPGLGGIIHALFKISSHIQINNGTRPFTATTIECSPRIQLADIV